MPRFYLVTSNLTA